MSTTTDPPIDRATINRNNARHSTGRGLHCSWRLNCARAYETNLLTLGAEEQAASTQVEDPEIHSALVTAKSYRAQAGAPSLRSARMSSAYPAPATANEPRSPYDATEDGFVLANDEIETNIRRDDRRTAARKAESRRSAPAEGHA